MLDSNSPNAEGERAPNASFARQQQDAVGGVFKKAWSDSAFRDELIENPDEILRGHEVFIEDGVHVAVVFETSKTKYFVVPAKPAGADNVDALIDALRLRME